MRRIGFGVAGLFVLLAGAAALALHGHPPERGAPSDPVAAVAAVPPPLPAQAAPAPRTAAADLPTRDIPALPSHVIDEDALPTAAAPVTLHARDGRVIGRLAGEAPRPGPAPAATGTTGMVAGTAKLDRGIGLAVDGRPLRLFGVRPPESWDRCAPPKGASRPCGEVARAALQARLAANPTVSCRVPPGQRFGTQGAVCLDSTGVDLGGFLVAEGFALADPKQSYDYVGAEGVARSFRRGLWRYR